MLPTVQATSAIALSRMAKSDDIDPETKARIAAHLRRKRKELGLSKRALALQIGITPPSLVKILNTTRNVGTAILLKIHRRLHIDLNQLVDIDPPREFFDSGGDDSESGRAMAAEPPSPYGASSSARLRKQQGGGQSQPADLNKRPSRKVQGHK
jgi:transcriptional regulator with XRE-family HTH domain